MATNRTIRPATGRPSWPVTLIAGREKAGKSYSAALASASDLIDRTFWISYGEKDPDEYGAVPGSRIEIVENDNTLTDLADAIQFAMTQPKGDKPHLLVIDSTSKVWESITARVNATAAKRGKRDRNGELVVGTDIWNKGNAEWAKLLNIIRRWDGPVILTARLDQVTVMDDRGLPTKDKTEKIKTQKNLPYDVDAIVEMPTRGQAILTGVRSVTYDFPERAEIPNFTVDGLWRNLGLDKTETAAATYSEPPAATSLDTEAPDITIPGVQP